MADLIDIWGSSDRAIVSDDSTHAVRLTNTNTTEGSAVRAENIGADAAFEAVVSGASGSVLKIYNIEKGYVSTNSTASLSFALRVDIGGIIYYMPVYLGKGA